MHAAVSTHTPSQVEDSVLPRLQQGMYFLLRHSQLASSGSEASGGSSSSSGTPVCLVSHSPSSGSSTRITMVYTPQEQRGRGHAKTAGVCWWSMAAVC